MDGYCEREREGERELDSEPQPPFSPSVRSAIHESRQLTSPIVFLFLTLPPAPCVVLLVNVCCCSCLITCKKHERVYAYTHHINVDVFRYR